VDLRPRHYIDDAAFSLALEGSMTVRQLREHKVTLGVVGVAFLVVLPAQAGLVHLPWWIPMTCAAIIGNWLGLSVWQKRK
jgi:hypothetical protein